MIWKSTSRSSIVKIIDYFTIFVTFYIAYFFWSLLDKKIGVNLIGNIELFSVEAGAISIIIPFIGVYIFKYFGAYSYQRFTSIKSEFRIIIKSVLLIDLLFIFFMSLARMGNVSRTYLLIFSITLLIFICIQKFLMFLIASRIRTKGKDIKEVLVIGSESLTIKFLRTAKNNPNFGLHIKGILTDKKLETDNILDYPILGEVKDFRHFLNQFKIDDVIVTLSLNEFSKIEEIIEICEMEGVQIRIISNFLGKVAKKLRADEIFEMQIISITMTHDNELQHLLKRTIDIVGASIAIIIFSPLMLLAFIGIYFSNGKPILYNWNVIGYNKKPFKSWKFRTMYNNADNIKEELMKMNEMSGPVFKIKNDPRIFPFGRFLRKWSIDELPQLFSVLKGDMSLVGPRPVFYQELINYQSWQRRKLSVKPGLTCLWQVNGRNQISDFNEWVKLDLFYIDNWNVWLDIKILLKTIPSVLMGKGAS